MFIIGMENQLDQSGELIMYPGRGYECSGDRK